MPVVESTADIIAIIGAATTLILGVVGGLRYSRCTKISCCWRAFEVEREVPPATPRHPHDSLKSELTQT